MEAGGGKIGRLRGRGAVGLGAERGLPRGERGRGVRGVALRLAAQLRSRRRRRLQTAALLLTENSM